MDRNIVIVDGWMDGLMGGFPSWGEIESEERVRRERESRSEGKEGKSRNPDD